MTNLMRDPFEQNVGDIQKSATSLGGAIAAPSTAYLYDWQMLPIGQLLWMKELETYREFPPLQIPGVLQPRRDREAGLGPRQPLA